MHHVAVFVAQNLHLDVLGIDQKLFDKDIVVAESLAGLVFDHLKRRGHILGAVAAAHTSAAAAGRCLEYHGEAVALRFGKGVGSILKRLFCAGYGGHAALKRYFLCFKLVSHFGQYL